MKRAKRIGILTCLLSILLLVNTAIAVEKEISDKKDAEYHIKLAKEYVEKNQFNEAIEEYTKAISIRPEDAYLYLARGKTYLIMPAPAPEEPIPSSEASAYNKAIEDYSKAIALQPDNVIFYVARADVYYLKEEWENAIKDLDKAIALKPDISFLYYERGNACHKIKQYRRAIDDFTKAINLKPDKQKYLSIKLSPYIEYLDVFDANWYLSNFYDSRAQSYQESLQINEAIKDYEKSVTISPYWYSFSLNILYEQENKLKEAIKFYSYAITLHPKSDTLYINRAYFYKRLKQHDKALKDFAKAIELNPKFIFHYSNRGDLYKELKQYDKAIGDYSRAIALEPNYQWFYYNRAELYVETNQKEKALHDFQKACDLYTAYCWRLTEYQKEIARGEKWVKFSQRESESLYYDKTSIRQQPNKHIRVWVRTEVEDISAYIEERKKNYQKTEGYENYSHSLMAWEFDCNSATVGEISLIDYDDKGKVLDSYHIDEKSINLKSVVPDSFGNALYKIVCKGKGKKD